MKREQLRKRHGVNFEPRRKQLNQVRQGKVLEDLTET